MAGRMAVWLAILFTGVGQAIAAPDGVSQVEILPDGVRFVLTAPAGEPRLVERAGEPSSIEWAGLASIASVDGWQLPVRTVWLGIPPEGETSVSYETLDGRPLDLGDRTPPASAGLPERSVELGALQWMRDQRVVPVSWTPIVRKSREATVETAVRVLVRFSGSRSGAGIRSTDAAWEKVYSALLVNYDQARSWRREAARPRRLQGESFWSTTSPWVRVEVSHGGLFAIRGTDLQTAGIDLGTIAPDSLRLFSGTGVCLRETDSVFDLPSELSEVAIRLEGSADGAFDPQDRILFHAVGPDGWYADFGLPDAKHERYLEDDFSNVNTYWLAWGTFEGDPRRWGVVDGSNVNLTPETSALNRVHYEKDLLWDARPRTVTGQQPPYPDTLPAWEKWHWLEIIASRGNTRSQLPFLVPDPLPDGDANLRLRMWGGSYVFSGRVQDHLVRIDINGTPIAERLWDDLIHRDVVVPGLRLVGDDQVLGIQVPFRGDTSDVTTDRQYLGWFELDYRRNLVARGDSIDFWIEPALSPRAFAVNGLSVAGNVRVLDVTDPRRTVEITPRYDTSGGLRSATWQTDGDADRLRHLRVVAVDHAARPRISVDDPPVGGYLRDRTAAVDYILITHRNFLDAAQTLADWRTAHGPDGQGLRVAVVDVQDVYDEFSAGRVDPTAIRNFLRWTYERWNGGDPTHRPTYVVFLGDASFDFRNRLQQGASVTVPTYEGYYDPVLRHSIYQPQFGTDDWYVLFDPLPDGSLDMAPGRLPADSPSAATALVEKVIDYESRQATGSWRQRFTLVADDICQGLSKDALGFTHMRQTESLADLLPVELRRDRVYLYEFGSECLYDRKPASAAALRELIDDGTLVVNYTGHGSEGQLADERVLETSGVGSMTNRDHLFFFLTASCSVGKFNFAGTGLGEALVRQPRGGAIGVLSATAVAFSGANAELNRAFFTAVWPDRDVLNSVPLGTATVMAKASVGNPAALNNRRYPLLGEPVIALGTPRLRCAMTLRGLRGGGVASPDTLYRGGRANLHGEIVDDAGAVRADYTGSVRIELYDSEIQREVVGEPGQGNVVYNLTGSPIFRGTTDVTNGQFDLSLIAPSALRTGPRGFAAVYAYADDAAAVEAIGALTEIIVPEIAPETSLDQDGPAITVRPLLVADLDAVPADARWQATMEDTSGINITQLVPSRSVLLRIEEGSRIVHLEDLAAGVAFPSGPSSGTVEFGLPSTLQPGVRYRLTLEASDNRDHRGSSAVEFRLRGTGTSGLDFARVYNVPNPTEGATTFFMEVNRPALVEIRVFTSSGRTIRTIRTPSAIQPAVAAAEGIRWDGRDEDGDPLANGVYFYKVTLRDDEGARESRIERLAVVR